MTLYQPAEAGADEVQQIGFALATVIAYLDSAVKRGVDIDNIAPLIWYLLGTNHRDFFPEIAKARALRRLYARTLKERYGAKNPKSMMLQLRDVPQRFYYNRDDGDLNVARGAVSVLSAALAGVQSISPITRSEALGTPSAEAGAEAIRIAQMVAYETGVSSTIDPLAGSYYVEWLTNDIEQRALKYMEEVEKLGGMISALEQGYPSRTIDATAYEWQRRVDSGENIIIGVNKFPFEASYGGRDFWRPEPQAIELRIDKMRQFKKQRDQRAVQKALDEVKRAAEREESDENNLMFPIIEAMKAEATVGEVCGVLRDVFGEYRVRLLF